MVLGVGLTFDLRFIKEISKSGKEAVIESITYIIGSHIEGDVKSLNAFALSNPETESVETKKTFMRSQTTLDFNSAWTNRNNKTINR